MDEVKSKSKLKGKVKSNSNITPGTWAAPDSAPMTKNFDESWKSPTKPISSLVSIQNEQLETKIAAKMEKSKSLAEIQAEELQLQEYQKYWTRVK